MKRIFKRNQVVLTLLAVMIAVAGYLNYAGKGAADADAPVSETGKDAPVGMQDISEEDILAENQALSDAMSPSAGETEGEETPVAEEIASLDNDPNDEAAGGQEASGNLPGEAILTSGTTVVDYLANVMLEREQVRARSKENYMEIINNAGLSEEAKQEAVASMLTLTQIAEKENSAETLLTAKGFDNSIVTIVDNQADVVIARASITDAERAQIEDIVKRKCEMEASQIVITLMELAQ
ncbi:MAG: SpoIIIAH-like family protein [Lachnospiraceae bacterium]|nr:SpoIIIAH-like family protein [Lachnospiraceae bacterium]